MRHEKKDGVVPKGIFSIPICKQDAQPIYLQLAEGAAKMIDEGILAPNEKLPPIRKLAEHYGVNNGTIVSFYKYLEQKKLVYARAGSGTYVSPLPLEEIPLPVGAGQMRQFAQGEDYADAINFVDTALPAELFPVEAFQRAFQEVLEKEKGAAFRYTDSLGYAPLRECLRTYLSSFGIQTDAEHIQIISGAQQGVDLVSKAMLGFGDVVLVERPTFYGAAGAFLSRGAKTVEIGLEEDGMDLVMLENMLKLYHPKFI